MSQCSSQSSILTSIPIVQHTMLSRADLVYWIKRGQLHTKEFERLYTEEYKKLHTEEYEKLYTEEYEKSYADKFEQFCAEELEYAAGLLGFELKQKSEQPQVDGTLQTSVCSDDVSQEEILPLESVAPKKPDLQFFRVISRERLVGDPEISVQSTEPLSIQNVGDFTQEELTPASTIPPPLQSLISWTRLWPVLKKHLHTSRQITLDIPCLIQNLATGRSIHRLPRIKKLSWATQIEILLDDNSRLIPFQGDFDTVCDTLQNLVGKFNLNTWKVIDIVNCVCVPWDNPQQDLKHWNLPLPTTPVLIMSDLGQLDNPKSVSRRHWLRLGRQLKAAGIMPFVLSPVSPEHIDNELSSYFHITLWNINNPLQQQYRKQNNRAQIQQLLALLSPAIRIETALLRALRHSLPADLFDSGSEAQFWLHPDVKVSQLAVCAIRDEESILQLHRAEFSRQPKQLQRQVIKLLHEHHASLFPAILHEETLIWASLVTPDLVNEYQNEIDEAKQFMCKMARMLYQRRNNLDQLQKSYGVRHLDRSHGALRRQHLYYSVLEGIVNQDILEHGIPLRNGIDRDELHRTLSVDNPQFHNCVVYQQDNELLLAQVCRPV